MYEMREEEGMAAIAIVLAVVEVEGWQQWIEEAFLESREEELRATVVQYT